MSWPGQPAAPDRTGGPLDALATTALEMFASNRIAQCYKKTKPPERLRLASRMSTPDAVELALVPTP